MLIVIYNQYISTTIRWQLARINVFHNETIDELPILYRNVIVIENRIISDNRMITVFVHIYQINERMKNARNR